MDIVLAIIFVLLGLVVGYFINVCADSLPKGESLIHSPYHHDTCQRRLALRGLIPVLSYLLMHGRCPSCQAPVRIRVLWVEIGTGLLFAVIFWRYGLSLTFAFMVAYCPLFLLLGIIDLENKLILNKITYPAVVVTLVVLSIDSMFIHLRLFNDPRFSPQSTILNGIIGGIIGFAFFFLVVMINPRGMGWGDVKMAGLIGLVVGFPLVFVSLFIGIFVGGIVAILLVVFRKRGKKSEIPFGVFLAIGAIVTLLWGSMILDWYLGSS